MEVVLRHHAHRTMNSRDLSNALASDLAIEKMDAVQEDFPGCRECHS